MQIVTPVDIADKLQAWLNANGVNACAEPLPRNLAASLPITLVQPIGGGRTDRVLDRHAVRLYTWAQTHAEAIGECAKAVAVLEAAAGQVLDGTQVYAVSFTALPYPAHDPKHQDIPRACTTADVFARATVTEI